MSDLFKDKYRIESTRLPGWDYASSGFYFVTICTHERAHYFGDVLIDNNGMTSVALSNIGKIARDCWLDISNHFPNASLDEWVVMPNHVHGIIVIGDNDVNTFCRDEAMPRLYKYTGPYPQMSKISPQPQSLSVIVGSFKSATSYKCHKQNLNFAWQSRFYDHIIRNEISLNKIRRYIRNNPQMWYRDRNNPEGLLM